MFKDGKEVSDYEGNRSSASLVDFAKQHESLGRLFWSWATPGPRKLLTQSMPLLLAPPSRRLTVVGR